MPEHCVVCFLAETLHTGLIYVSYFSFLIPRSTVHDILSTDKSHISSPANPIMAGQRKHTQASSTPPIYITHIKKEHMLWASGTGSDDIKTKPTCLQLSARQAWAHSPCFHPQPASLTLVTVREGNCVSWRLMISCLEYKASDVQDKENRANNVGGMGTQLCRI